MKITTAFKNLLERIPMPQEERIDLSEKFFKEYQAIEPYDPQNKEVNKSWTNIIKYWAEKPIIRVGIAIAYVWLQGKIIEWLNPQLGNDNDPDF